METAGEIAHKEENRIMKNPDLSHQSRSSTNQGHEIDIFIRLPCYKIAGE
jgi:hypothetical protein